MAATPPYFFLPSTWPPDGATVWIRTIPEGTAPFLATFTLATFQFQPTFGGPPMPWYFVARWRVQ